MGAVYNKTSKDKWQLLNHLSGEAKMAIYISRKNFFLNLFYISTVLFIYLIHCSKKLKEHFENTTSMLSDDERITYFY